MQLVLMQGTLQWLPNVGKHAAGTKLEKLELRHSHPQAHAVGLRWNSTPFEHQSLLIQEPTKTYTFNNIKEFSEIPCFTILHVTLQHSSYSLRTIGYLQ